jgi:Protein of unknown function (DUF4058)
MRKKSPFPGMDPWLEDYWGDIHARLTTYASDRLQPDLPKGLKARIEEYVTVESKLDDEEWRHHFVPHVMITAPFRLSKSEQEGSVAVVTETEAVLLPREVEAPTLRRIQIIDTQNGNRVITTIEFLSPANKVGRGLDLYLKKQREMIDGRVNLVEIDLVRTGDWAVAVDVGHVPVKLRGIYRATVVREVRTDQCEYYPIPLTAPLPKLRIPLRPTDADVVLELQPLIEAAYTNGGYADDIDYGKSPLLPLPKIIEDWTSDWLKKHQVIDPPAN